SAPGWVAARARHAKFDRVASVCQNPSVNDRLEAPRFFSRTVAELPGDPESDPGTRQVLGACYSRTEPTPTSAPRLIAHSAEVARLLGVSEADLRSERWTRVLTGN